VTHLTRSIFTCFCLVPWSIWQHNQWICFVLHDEQMSLALVCLFEWSDIFIVYSEKYYCLLRTVWWLYCQESRSVGDFYLKKPEYSLDPLFRQVGAPVALKRPTLSAEPSIQVRKLKPNDLFLIFASDGLWEHLSDDAAVQIVFKNPRTVSYHHRSFHSKVCLLFCVVSV
jgi:hypothetical protein